MKKTLNLLILVLFTGVLFIACEEDDKSEPKEKELVPVKISEYEDNILSGETIIQYNDQNKIIKTDNGDGFYQTYEYSSNGNLEKANIYDENELSGYNTFEYNSSNQLIKIYYYNTDDEVQSYYVHEYDNVGNVIKKTLYGTDDAVVSYYTFSYDSNGNMTTQRYYWVNYETGEVFTEEYEEWTYSYDDKNHIYKSAKMPFVWQTHINNPVQITFTQHYGNNYSETQTNIYVYNEDNYPIEYTESDDNEKYVIEYMEI